MFEIIDNLLKKYYGFFVFLVMFLFVLSAICEYRDERAFKKKLREKQIELTTSHQILKSYLLNKNIV